MLTGELSCLVLYSPASYAVFTADRVRHALAVRLLRLASADHYTIPRARAKASAIDLAGSTDCPPGSAADVHLRPDLHAQSNARALDRVGSALLLPRAAARWSGVC